MVYEKFVAAWENGSREAIYNRTVKKMDCFGVQKRAQPLLKKRVIESQYPKKEKPIAKNIPTTT